MDKYVYEGNIFMLELEIRSVELRGFFPLMGSLLRLVNAFL